MSEIQITIQSNRYGSKPRNLLYKPISRQKTSTFILVPEPITCLLNIVTLRGEPDLPLRVDSLSRRSIGADIVDEGKKLFTLRQMWTF